MLSRFSHVWLFATPWTVARQGPLSMRSSRQEYWSGLPCPSPRDLPQPGMEPMSLMSPALAAGCFTTGATCEALQVGVAINYRAHTHRHAHTNAPKSFSIHLPLQTSSYAGSCSPLKKWSLFSPADLSLHQPSCPSPHLSILTSSSSLSIAVCWPCSKSICSDLSSLVQSKH